MIWKSMLQRCYSKDFHEKSPTYEDCTVDERWHNYQNFAEWLENNYVEGFEIDKDILIKSNKVYSPETCTFVPREINALLIKRQNHRGAYPLGMCKQDNKFIVTVNKNTKSIYVGYYNTPEEAFEAYKIAKEHQIREVAELWKDKILEKTYQALINYKIEIND